MRFDKQKVGTPMTMRGLLVLGVAAAALLAIAACEPSFPVPPGGGDQAVNSTWLVPPSIDEQIFTSSVIVRATLASATAGTETVEGSYLPIQTLSFTVHEYLKGSGTEGSQIEVVVRGHSYPTESEAQAEADRAISQRNTDWDDRQGILFLGDLNPPFQPSGASGSSDVPTYGFTLSNPVVQSPWDYSIDSLSRAWIPAKDAGGASGQSSDTAPLLNSVSPTPEISLADLRAKIAAQTAELTLGAGIEGYEQCIYGKVIHERYNRARLTPWTPTKQAATLTSGSAARTQVWSDQFSESEPKYHVYWLSGPDATLFLAPNLDDDTDPSNGYSITLAIARPLPTGQYRVHHNWQHYTDIPCNFRPTDAYDDFTVTVTAPEGVLHEAFFDPVALGSGVGVDGVNGVLKPAEFSVGETSTSVTGLKWENREVVLSLSTQVSVEGYRLEFIELDGSVGLSLEVDGASVDAGEGTLTWGVSEQPWEAGDLLMLRIVGG